jgi:phosphotransferase system enzyme I (PtsI)
MERITVINHDSRGIATGKAYVVKRENPETVHRFVEDTGKKNEEERFSAALKKVLALTREMAAADPIFTAHMEIIQDETLWELTVSGIHNENKCAELSLKDAGDQLCAMFENIGDPYLRERASDIRDVVNRIMLALKGETVNPFAGIRQKVIVVADELFPSDTIQMDFSRVCGLITRRGATTSHVSIIARNRGIPALTGLGDDILKLRDGNLLILDGEKGEIIVNPDEITLDKYQEKAKTTERQKSLYQNIKDLEAVTSDGFPIELMANVSGADDVAPALNKGASGIGLFRSEFLFMQYSEDFPDEEAQFAEYKKAAEICGNHPLIIRTLDIGGDKSLPCFSPGKEDNPFLGWRAIRISLSETAMFKVQLRAILRASAFGNIQIMFPMIISMEEWREARLWVDACKNELQNEGLAFKEDIELGVMVETPAAVMIAEDLAAEADFLSIGTNDLTQYTLAVDRLNPRVSGLFDPLHPAVVRSIGMVVKAADLQGKPAGICGESAGNPDVVKLLLGLGLKKLSMAPVQIPEIKYLIRNTSMTEARQVAQEIVKKNTIREIRNLLGIESS